jgi:hypothetical protein
MIRPHPYFRRKVTVHVSLLVVCPAHNHKDAQNTSSVTCFRPFFRILLGSLALQNLFLSCVELLSEILCEGPSPCSPPHTSSAQHHAHFDNIMQVNESAMVRTAPYTTP